MWINGNDERRRAYQQARELAAESYADEAVTIVDQANPDTVAVARARADYRRWLAQSFDRERYATNVAQPPAPILNIGQLHLQALLAANAERQRLASGLRTLPATPESPAADDAAQRMPGTLAPVRIGGCGTPVEGGARAGADTDPT